MTINFSTTYALSNVSYPTQITIELVHGARNIQIWADLDNSKNSITVKNRVEWAAKLATEYVNGRFALNRYEVPFIAVPKMIIHISSLLAGVLLYDGRTQSDQIRDMVLPKRKEFRRLMREILSGQLKLIHPTSSEPIECV